MHVGDIFSRPEEQLFLFLLLPFLFCIILLARSGRPLAPGTGRRRHETGEGADLRRLPQGSMEQEDEVEIPEVKSVDSLDSSLPDLCTVP
jgi:hypothetical protein